MIATKRLLFLVLGIVVGPAPHECILGAQASLPNQPSVILLLADDQSYETIGALGHTDIDTPNLDQLVRAGTTFTHAYNMGGWHGAICVASRSMLNTGRMVSQCSHVQISFGLLTHLNLDAFENLAAERSTDGKVPGRVDQCPAHQVPKSLNRHPLAQGFVRSLEQFFSWRSF